MLQLHLLLLGLFVLAASSEQFYANRYGKRQEFAGSGSASSGSSGPGPHGQQYGFQSGSRYGRTDPDAVPLGPDDRLQRRFYANGRYGKRASSAATEYQLLEDAPLAPYIIDDDSQMLCRYTGVANLYRCARRKDSEDEPGMFQDSSAPGSSVTGNPLN